MTTLPGISNRRVAEAMGDYRNIAAEPEGVDPALDDLAQAVCGLGGHLPPRDRALEPCDFHRRTAAGYLRVVEAATATSRRTSMRDAAALPPLPPTPRR